MSVNLLPDNSYDWRRNSKSIDKYRFASHFLPHPDKKKRAGLLSHGAILSYCLILIFILSVFRIVPRYLPGVLGYASNINVTDLLKYTNQKRVSEGLSELVLDDALSRAAEQKARHMFSNNYWAHVSPSGREPWYFILAEDYDYVYAGENLAKNFSTSKEVVDAWYASPSHKANLMSPNYDEMGFAVVNGVLEGYETTLVVQMFGRPRDQALVATKQDEERLLEEISVEPVQVEVPVIHVVPTSQRTEVLPLVDVASASRGVSIAFAAFVIFLLALDVWYSKRRGIAKLTGHTLAHLSILVLVLISIVILFKPGAVL